MSTGWAIFWLVYIIGCMLSVYPIAKAVLHDEPDHAMAKTLGDYVAAIAMGFGFCWAWPLAVPGWFIYKALKTDHDK